MATAILKLFRKPLYILNFQVQFLAQQETPMLTKFTPGFITYNLMIPCGTYPLQDKTILLTLSQGQVNLDVGQVNLYAGQVYLDAGQVDFDAGQVDFDARQVDLDAGQVNLDARQVDISYIYFYPKSKPLFYEIVTDL